MLKNNLKIIGIHKHKKYKITSKEAIKLENRILELLKLNSEYYKKELENCLKILNNCFLAQTSVYKNKVVLSGRSVLAGVLANNYSNDAYINYGALGNDSTMSLDSNTKLGNETNRTIIASNSSSDNIAIISTYWSTSEANSQHYEAGEFINGSSTTDSGVLFSHWNIDESKTSSESLTIESTYTII